MSENIFVGARYIIRYMGNWDASMQYESLSAVIYGGNAYVSNKPVPAGTLPTDTTYWAFWGSGNSVIDTLQVRVSNLENTVTDLGVRISGAENDILGIGARLGLAEKNIDELFASRSEMQALIHDLQDTVSAISISLPAIENELSLTEKLANKNATGGYMGIDSSGYAAMPTYRAMPITLTAHSISSLTIGSRDRQDIIFGEIIDRVDRSLNRINLNTTNGTFSFGATNVSNYHVFITASVLCVPTGGSGVKDIAVLVGNDVKYVCEGWCPTTNARVSFQIPYIYLGALSRTDQFRISAYNWAIGDQVGQGSLVPSNLGSTWASVVAYPA